MFGADPLSMVAKLLPHAGPAIRDQGRELLDLVAERHTGALGEATPWPDPPAWARAVLARAATSSGTSPALLEAVAGELSGFRPDAWAPRRVGLMGHPVGDSAGAEYVVQLDQLAAGDPDAAAALLWAVTQAGHQLRDLMKAGPVAGLRWWIEQGRAACDPPAVETVRAILGRYTWALLARVPSDRARELRGAFR